MRRAFSSLIHGTIFFLCSCVPGCGQMYQGYMKRGISHTLLSCAVLAVAVFLQIGAFAVLLAPIFLYSFFDSYNLRRQLSGRGLDALDTPGPDAYLFSVPDLDFQRLQTLFGRRHSLIGWVLVFLGVYGLYATVIQRVMRGITNLFPWLDWLYDLLVWDMPRIMGTLLIIALGIWFIRGPRRKEPDIPSFTPPPETEEPPVYQSEFFAEEPHAPDITQEAKEDGHGDA